MLTIETVNSTGLFCFGDVNDIDMQSLGLCKVEGRNLDEGGSNGSGKTSILNTIPQILFAESESRATAAKVSNDVWKKGTCATVVFTDHKGSRYRVRLVRSWKGTPELETGIYLDYWNGGDWIDKRGASVHETKKAIQDIVGFGYKQFLNVAYMTQRSGLKFIEEPNSRAKILTEMLELELYDKAAEIARKQYRELNKELDGIQSQIDSTESNIRESEERMQDELQELDKQCELVTKRKGLNKITLEKYESNFGVLDKFIKDNELKLGELNSEVQEIKKDYELAAKDINNTVPEKAEDYKQGEMKVKIELDAKKFELSELLSEGGKCPKCGTDVTDEHLQEIKDELNVQIEDLQKAFKNWGITIQELWERHEKRQQEKLDGIYKNQNERIEIVENDKKQIVGAISEVRIEYNELNEKIGEVRLTVNRDESELSSIDGQKKVWEKTRIAIEEKEKQLKGMKQEVCDKSDIIDKYKWVEKHFKLLKLHLFEEALTMLNKLMGRFLGLLCDGGIAVTFDNRKLKAGVKDSRKLSDEDYIQNLSVSVQHGNKKNVVLEDYSGGEKQIIALALIASFWELVDNMTQNGVNILMLDEIFGNLDDVRKEGAIRFLEYLKNKEKSILVTDNTGVCNNIEFDNVLVSEKKDDISTIYLEAA